MPKIIKAALGALLPERTAFRLLAERLRRTVRHGGLAVYDPWGGRHVFGAGGPPFATVRIADPRTPARLLANPSLELGEAYMDGRLEVGRGELRDLLQIAVAAAGELARQDPPARGAAPPRPGRAGSNSVARARANVAHHYDLSEALYRLFLDEDLQYSCAYFPRGDETLEAAQAKKKAHLAAKLRLAPGARVLDIGCGWGGLALDLARRHATVDGLTLSREQLAVARSRADHEALGGRARFHLRDYREAAGVYDRIVSVGMFEHVGAPHFRDFFETVGRLLAPDGVAVIHAIGHMGPPGLADPWIEKHIFPGGYCPALSEVLAAVEQAGLWVTDLEILRLHYADTLRCWSERFQANRASAAALYDERFCRMWEFYLAACEACFRVGGMMVFQIQLARDVHALPRSRDYMFDDERAALSHAPPARHPQGPGHRRPEPVTPAMELIHGRA